MARPTIVVSTGRSGSTLVSRMVREHRDVLSLSEFFVLLGDAAFPDGSVSGPGFWEMLSRPGADMRRVQRSGLRFDEVLYWPGPGTRFTDETGVPPVLLTTLPHLVDDSRALFDELATWVPRLDERPVGDQYRRLFAWLCRRLGREIWVERSGASLPMVPTLSRLFPEAGFVHLYRDGRECAVSMSQHVGFKLLALRSRPDLAPADMMAGDRLNGPAVSRMRIPPEVFGSIWSDMVVAGAPRLAELAPGRVTSIRYEELVDRPADELRRLAAFIGVEADPGWLRRATALVRPRPSRWPALPEPDRRRLAVACAPGMELLYGPRGRTAVT
jgi:hypothetical protein